MTPEELRAEILKVRAELLRAPGAVRDLEVEAELAELEAEKALDVAFLSAEGSVEERKAKARTQTVELREAIIVPRAAYNRARLKVRQLESELVALQSVLKSAQLEGA